MFGREITAQGEVGPLKMYDFEPGTPYRVPRELAEHLQDLGYLYAGKIIYARSYCTVRRSQDA